MQKMILVITTLLLIASANIAAYAQGTEKKDDEKTTTADAWRQALPQGEQPLDAPPVVVMEESKDNVEAEEAAALTEKRILNLEQRLLEAVKQRDSVALQHLLADDFLPAGMVNTAGAQPDKTRYIEWAIKNLEIKSYNSEKPTVRVYDAAAVVTFRYKRQASIAGLPSDGDFIVTDVWVKRGKLWQAVSHHESQLSKP